MPSLAATARATAPRSARWAWRRRPRSSACARWPRGGCSASARPPPRASEPPDGQVQLAAEDARPAADRRVAAVELVARPVVRLIAAARQPAGEHAIPHALDLLRGADEPGDR